MFVVTCCSLLLLVYVGFGEARRTYEKFIIDKAVSQGLIVQSAIENYLRAGLPLKEYAGGFSGAVQPILGLEEVDAVAVYDHAGQQLFRVVDPSNPPLPEPSALIKLVKNEVEIETGDTHVQVVVPLRTRFETTGSLVITAGKRMLSKRMQDSFRPSVYFAVGLSLLFASVVAIFGPFFARARLPWLQIGYGLIFLSMAGVVIATLVSLYSQGVQDKARAAAFTLAERLKPIAEYRLSVRDFSSINQTFARYRASNPELREAALLIDGVVAIGTEPARIGRPWRSDIRDFEYTRDLSPVDPYRRAVRVAVPKRLVYREVERSVRNFAALFIGCAFLAGLFLQVASSLQHLREAASDSPDARDRLSEERAVVIAKPIFFLAVFIEHLTYSFLPQFMQAAASGSGMSVGFATAPFTAYYLCFALSLIPAGYLADRYGPRPLIWLGLFIASTTLLGLAAPVGIVGMTALRAASGIGQGMLFIGIQAYILAVASPDKKTRAAAIIVFGFQGGMISGMAIGSLLVTYLQVQGVFVLSAAIGAATVLYSVVMIPPRVNQMPAEAGFGASIRRAGADLRRVMASGEFLKTMLCIGVPAKAILTGVITFALPLLLAQQAYRQEEIGQIIMLYGIGVVTATAYASRLVDRSRNTEAVLFWGAAVSGLGLVLASLAGSSALGSTSSTIVVVCAVVLVGIAHGFINAPVVTHVAQSELAQRIGTTPVTTTYRFLERAGHIVGPFLMGQLFLVWGQHPQIFAWLGIATVTLGFVFAVRRPAPPPVGAVGAGRA